MNIRLASEKDIRSVADIYEEIHTEEEAGRVTIGWSRGIYPTAATARDAVGRGDLFVQEDNGRIVGAAIINRQQVAAYRKGKWKDAAPENEVMVLHTLVISPSASGKGYGKQFVAFYEQYAREHGCRYLRMDTNARNTRARALYQKLDYAEPDIVPCVFNGIEGVQLVLLEKKLDI